MNRVFVSQWYCVLAGTGLYSTYLLTSSDVIEWPEGNTGNNHIIPSHMYRFLPRKYKVPTGDTCSQLNTFVLFS